MQYGANVSKAPLIYLYFFGTKWTRGNYLGTVLEVGESILELKIHLRAVGKIVHVNKRGFRNGLSMFVFKEVTMV